MKRRKVMEVKFYEEMEDGLLKFAVIVAVTDGKYVFCKHRDRDAFLQMSTNLKRNYITR